jgi:hypothetical protein
MFTARTTRVSNPLCSPGFRSSPSDPYSSSAFATGAPPGILGFHPYPGNSLDAVRSLDLKYPLHVQTLSAWISQRTCRSGYGHFKPNNSDYHLGSGYYRGGWQPCCPPLVPAPPYSAEKRPSVLEDRTRSPPIALACIVKVSCLLHPVGSGFLSQKPTGSSRSHGYY